MAEIKRTAIIDKDGNNVLANVVESSSAPGTYGLVALNPDGSTIGGGGGGGVQSVTGGTGISITGTATDPVVNSTITQYTDELAQDAVGTILTDTDTIDLTYNDGTPSISGAVRSQMSITSDASGLKLSGDSTSPGNNKVYGTNGSGVKGWKDDPSGGSNNLYVSYYATYGSGFFTGNMPGSESVFNINGTISTGAGSGYWVILFTVDRVGGLGNLGVSFSNPDSFGFDSTTFYTNGSQSSITGFDGTQFVWVGDWSSPSTNQTYNLVFIFTGTGGFTKTVTIPFSYS